MSNDHGTFSTDPTDDFERATTIILRKPVVVGGDTYSELSLREPTVDEWLEFGALEGPAGDLRAIEIVSGVPEAALRQIGVSEMLDAAHWLTRFLA